jgi:hypothetical protein
MDNDTSLGERESERDMWLEYDRTALRIRSAAPELLEVANKAFDFLGGVDGAAEIRAELLSAIAKATQP